MKEVKYNIKYLLNKKELYFSIIGILLINLIHVLLVIYHDYDFFYEMGYRAEYLTILYNVDVNINMILILIFPIICSTVFSDISWFESKQKIDYLLCNRLNYKKLIIIRFFLILLIVFFIVFVGFLLNYITLCYIYGSGNALTYFQSPAFFLVNINEYFLDGLRIFNPTLFIVIISFHVSILIALLSGLAYSASFYIKQRVMIYIFPFLVLVGSELLSSVLIMNQYSIVHQLQPFTTFSAINALSLYLILGILCFALILIHIRKKDLL